MTTRRSREPGSRSFFSSLSGLGAAPLLGVATGVALAALAAPASAASLQEITNFGNNPSNIKMYLYVPAGVKAKPPILVGVHWCHGTGPDFYTGTKFASLADKYGFIIVYPSAVSSDGCWDVHSQAALTHNGGSDPSGIISMVKYVEDHNGGDPDRVYVTGHSSGGMMTNVLMGSYPDVFKAGAAFAGVPFSCFSGADTWNTNCATGKITKTAAQWGDAARAAYPGYNGPRPRVQLWHGTLDDTLLFHNFGEEIKLWTNVLGVSQTPTTTENNQPQQTWTRTRYADASGTVLVEAVQEEGQPHNLQIVADQAVHFFGLDGSGPGGPAPAPDAGTGTGGKDGGAAEGSGDAGRGDARASADSGASGGSGGAGGSSGSGGSGGDVTGSGGSSGSGGASGGAAGAAGTGGSGGNATGTGGSGGAGTGGSSAAGGAGEGGKSGGAAGSAGTGGSTTPAASDAGCSCRIENTAAQSGSAAGLGALLLAALVGVRRRSRAR